MGAAGRLGVLCFLFFFVFFGYIFLMMAWVGVGWDVNVPVTLMMLR